MKKIGPLLLVSAVVISIYVCVSPKSSAPSKVPPTAYKPWQPSGFTRWDDKTAYRWLPKGEYSCSYSRGKCAAAEIVAHYGCLDLYVEVAFYDSSGIQIDWTNETAKGLSAGGKAHLVFDSFEDRASKVEMVKISCH